MSEQDKRIQAAFDALNKELILPDSLSPENIQKKTGQTKQISAKKSKRTFVGIAAVFAVALFAGIFAAVGLHAPVREFEPIRDQNMAVAEKEEFAFNGELKSYTSYSELKKDAEDHAVDKAYWSSWGMKAESEADSAYDFAAQGTAYNGSFDDSLSETETEEFGKTNVQVGNVDEADILKNDGRYLYYSTYLRAPSVYDHTEGEFTDVIVIADCADPENIKQVAAIRLPAQENEHVRPLELYVTENKLAVLANAWKTCSKENATGFDEDCNEVTDMVVCDLYYPYGTENYMILYIYDITDRTMPVLENRFSQDGTYLGSRLVKDQIIFWTSYYADLSSKQAASDTCIPATSDGLLPADRIACAGDYNSAYVILSNYSLAKGEAQSVSVCGNGMEAYCTADTLYLACYCEMQSDEIDYYDVDQAAVSATEIIAFDITDGIRSGAVGKVLATPLNQFSMDEYNGSLRIATTGYVGKHTNYVSVLDKDTLNVTGFIGDIAPGETIRSVRFIGNTGYVVTFLQTDPLFVIDLSDPTKPEIKAELKLPGFSSYLHPFGEKYLIGIGYGGTESGLDGSTKFSLFDIADPENPKEVSVAVIENSYLMSESHKAFCILGEDTFAVAVSVHELEKTDDSVMMSSGVKMAVLKVANGEITVSELLELPSREIFCDFRATYIKDSIFVLGDSGIDAYDRSFFPIGSLRFSPYVEISLAPEAEVGANF